MSAQKIKISYSSNAGDAYEIYLDKFLDEDIPRQIISQTAVEFSPLGAPYTTGPSSVQPKIWTINTILEDRITSSATKNTTPSNEADLFLQLYNAWDTDRANGLAAKCQIEDEILAFGSSYTADIWFTEPPTYSLVGSKASKKYNVVFGLTEVS